MATVIEQIKERLPITEVLGSYITLIPAGNQFKAKCPFHIERTASFSVSPERNAYYCFGCGAKGDIFNFVEAFEGLDFKGALRLLADRAHVSLTAQYDVPDDTDELYAVHEKAAALYQEALKNSPDVTAYIAKRGVSEKTIADFRIGYVSDEWRYLAIRLSQKEMIAAEKAGLLQKTPKGYYDRFRGRIMFPLFDGSGRIIAFSGRVFPEKTKEQADAPKYINSPETEIFHKSRVLYGFNRAKEAVRRHGFSILVEGQFDLILSHQNGFTNTVATSGTAVSEEAATDQFSNLAVLSRLSQNSILAFDGDDAGIKARTRAALVMLTLGMQPKVATLPAEEDPATILARDPKQWKDILKSSVHSIDAELRAIVESGSSIHTQVSALHKVVFPLLARIPSAIERQAFISRVADTLGMPPRIVEEDFERFAQSKQLPKESEEDRTNRSEPITPYERLVLLMEYLDEERIKIATDALANIAFKEKRFDAAPILAERKEALQFWSAQEYGLLGEQEKAALVTELIEYIARSFYDDIHLSLTQILRRAEVAKNDFEIECALTDLNLLYAIRQSARGA